MISTGFFEGVRPADWVSLGGDIPILLAPRAASTDCEECGIRAAGEMQIGSLGNKII
jgi:hypothetical protein